MHETYRILAHIQQKTSGRLRSLHFDHCVPYIVENPPRSSDRIIENHWTSHQWTFLHHFDSLISTSHPLFHTIRFMDSYHLSVMSDALLWTLTRYRSQSIRQVVVEYDQDFISEDRSVWLMSTWPHVELFSSKSMYTDDVLRYMADGWAQSLTCLKLKGVVEMVKWEAFGVETSRPWQGFRRILEKCTLLRELELGSNNVMAEEFIVECADAGVRMDALRVLSVTVTQPWSVEAFQGLRDRKSVV